MNTTFQLDGAGAGIYRCAAFLQFPWQSHGFGTRQANPLVNVTLRQIHSAMVLDAHGLKDRAQEGDALITNEPGLSIGVRTADCVPILLLDSAQRAVAAVHAGWRGSAAGIVRATIRQMGDVFCTKPQDLHAAIGPCIRECCYEVSADVISRFAAVFPEWHQIPAKAEGKRNLNLAEANIRQLTGDGVPADQIFDSGLCTFCQPETLFSFRREPENPGRLLSAISRVF